LNRDQLAALARGVITLAAGATILYAIGRYIGWCCVAAIAGAGIADSLWCWSRLPVRWRPW